MPGVVQFVLLSCLMGVQQGITVEVHSTQSPEAFNATWIALSAEAITVLRDGSELEIATSNLQSIRFPGSSSNPIETTLPGSGDLAGENANTSGAQGLEVLLHDGSRLFPRSISSSGQSIVLGFSEEFSVSLATSHVRSVQLQPLTSAQQSQWEAILDSRIVADTLVLIRSAESLDKVDGLISEIGAESIRFEFGGQTFNAPRSRLAGLRLFSPPSSLKSTKCTVTDIWGNAWQVTRVIAPVTSRHLELMLGSGAQVNLPLASISSLDYSLGNQVYVADLTPLDQGRQGGIQLDIPLPGGDQLFGAHPIKLPKTAGSSLRFLGSGWSTFRVPSDYSQLVGKVYLAPSGNHYTACTVRIQLENDVVWEQQLTELSQRLELAVPVEAEKRVRLEVVPQSEFPTGDVVIWQELRFLK